MGGGRKEGRTRREARDPKKPPSLFELRTM